MAVPICLVLLRQVDRRAASCALAKTAMMAITTRSSMRVKPLRLMRFVTFIFGLNEFGTADEWWSAAGRAETGSVSPAARAFSGVAGGGALVGSEIRLALRLAHGLLCGRQDRRVDDRRRGLGAPRSQPHRTQ